MSILIRGMEMPKDHPLWIVVHPDGTVEANEVRPPRPVVWQTLLNAAVPVPPHGRLIDADAILGDRSVGMQIVGLGRMLHETVIEFAPTVIPAEEER